MPWRVSARCARTKRSRIAETKKGPPKPLILRLDNACRRIATLRAVGHRHVPDPVILAIQAAEAHQAGVAFYHGHQDTWLADFIPPEFIAPLDSYVIIQYSKSGSS